MRLVVLTLALVFAALLFPQRATAQICDENASGPCFVIEATPTWVRNLDMPTYTPPGFEVNGPLGTVHLAITVRSMNGFVGLVNLAFSCCNDGTDNPMVPSGPLPPADVAVNPVSGPTSFT
jgi:hypothetical protein